MLCSSIDLGTNTCLLLIAECDPISKEVKKVLSDNSTIVRLGQGVDQNKSLHPDAMKRTLDCLKRYSDKVREFKLNPNQTVCVATSQARDSKNGKDFFAQIEKETGFRFSIISGDQEAKSTFLGGLLPGDDPHRSVVIDIGGGSTELMAENGGESLDIGSVRFTERYLKSDPVKDEEFWTAQENADAQLESLLTWRQKLENTPVLVAVAGTATTLAQYFLGLEKFDAGKIDGTVLTRGDIHRMVEELKWRSVSERKKLPGIDEGRADVLLAGALILWRAMEVLHFSECKISTRGLRYGVLKANLNF